MNMKENFLNFIDSVKPEKDFIDEEIPKAPNYDDKSYWAALPERCLLYTSDAADE